MVIRNNNHNKKDDAVSPVVGVMLMIVITVVIAAVVGVTASGVLNSASAQSEHPTIEFVGLYGAGYTAATMANIPRGNVATEAGGLLFKVTGNAPVDLTRLKIESQSSTGSGGYCVLTYDDPCSAEYLPGGPKQTGNGGKGKLLPPEYMRGHRIVIFGVDPEDTENLYRTIAEPGEMFIVVPEYVNFPSPSLAIGLRVDDETGTQIMSGGMDATGGTYLSVSDTKTGAVYIGNHVLVETDLISTV